MYRLLIIDGPDSCENVKGLIDWSGYGFHVVMTANSQMEGIKITKSMFRITSILCCIP